MIKTRMKTLLCVTAVLALAAAPVVQAEHGPRDGWRDRGGYGHHDRDVRWHGEYRRGWRGHDHDGFGRWVAGAVVLGALTNLVVDATRPRVTYYYEQPPVVYSRTRIIYRDAPVERVYEERVYEGRPVYVDPYRTRYIGHEDDDDDE